MDYVGRVNEPLAVGPWPIFAADGFSTVPGQAAATDWTLYRAGDVFGAADGPNANAVQIVELEAKPGRYRAVFTPREPGNYTLEVRHPGAEGGAAVHLEAPIRVDSVTLSDVGGFAVVPLERGIAPLGQPVELRVRWVLPDGTAFEPHELRKVEIRDAATDRLIWTIGAADIEALGAGVYRVFTPIAPGEPLTLRDRWFFRGFTGPEVTREFTRLVAESLAGADDLLVGVERLKRFELGGVDLRDNQGRPFPEQDYIDAIREAQDTIAAECDITLAPAAITERHAYRLDQYQMFGWFELDRRPVAEVLSVKAVWQSTGYALDFPPEWIVVESPNFGSINLVPQNGSLQQFLTLNGGNGGALLPILRPNLHSWWPGLFEVRYRAGFDVGKCPPRIQKAVALLAAIPLLDKAGEMILGSGIATMSIGVGGFSQSVGTTSSATNAGHGALILDYRKTLDELLPAIRRQYHGVSIGCA